MDSCNGYTHHWMDDSYSYGSYPCPGPEECPESKLPRKDPHSHLPPALRPKNPPMPAWDTPPGR